MMGFGFFDSFMFNAVPIIISIMFVVVIGMLIVNVVRGAKQWNKNNNSPVLIVDAKVVTKRTDVSYHMHNTANDNHHNSSSTWYYVTFEVESGDRIELSMTGQEFGLLVEGDAGRLTFQGTRYKGFQRR